MHSQEQRGVAATRRPCRTSYRAKKIRKQRLRIGKAAIGLFPAIGLFLVGLG
jgi:hypothetical protein